MMSLPSIEPYHENVAWVSYGTCFVLWVIWGIDLEVTFIFTSDTKQGRESQCKGQLRSNVQTQKFSLKMGILSSFVSGFEKCDEF